MKKASIYVIAPLLLLLFPCFCAANAYDIKQACSKAWGAEGENYTQCVMMLQADPKPDKADKKCIIEVAVNAAVKQIRVNMQMYESDDSVEEDEKYKEAWDICIDAHKRAKSKMEQVDVAFEAGGRELATIFCTAASDSIAVCNQSFKSLDLEPKHEKENSMAIHLIDQVSKFIQQV